jgi:hypothetical protein
MEEEIAGLVDHRGMHGFLIAFPSLADYTRGETANTMNRRRWINLGILALFGLICLLAYWLENERIRYWVMVLTFAVLVCKWARDELLKSDERQRQAEENKEKVDIEITHGGVASAGITEVALYVRVIGQTQEYIVLRDIVLWKEENDKNRHKYPPFYAIDRNGFRLEFREIKRFMGVLDRKLIEHLYGLPTYRYGITLRSTTGMVKEIDGEKLKPVPPACSRYFCSQLSSVVIPHRFRPISLRMRLKSLWKPILT